MPPLALLILLSVAHPQPLAWDADAFSALKARLVDEGTVPPPTAAPADLDAAAHALFARPLIIGASVSADFRAPSPGRLLTERSGGTLTLLARSGATGASQVALLTPAALAGATSIVGLDLFFWDTRRDCAAGLAAVDELFTRAGSVPVIVGNIPPLPGDHDCRAALNARLAAACSAAPSCLLLDFDALYREAAGPGIELDGRRLGLSDLLADGLHLNSDGSRVVAERLAARLRAR
jgi:hypothetical protein